MSESGYYDPGPWTGHDFDSARDAYDAHAGRSYADASRKGIPASSKLEANISTKATNPLLILSDVTGSMGEWPKTMFSKLPYLEHEAKEYLGEDLEIAFGAIGDAFSDTYSLQMRPFTKGTNLKERMLELVVEGRGGDGIHESYEIGLLYLLHKVSMPNAIGPVAILIGDELPYDFVSPDVAEKVAGVRLEKRLTTVELVKLVKERYALYLIRKPYGSNSGNGMSESDRTIRETWVKLLGADHVCDLPDPKRVVDVIFGILAKEAGRIEDFREELEGRQTLEQVTTVYKSLATVHGGASRAKKPVAGHSILKIEGASGGTTKKLL